MQYRQLADTGVFVSELCLGTMTFGGRGQMWEVIGGLDQSAADAIVGRALDAGVKRAPHNGVRGGLVEAPDHLPHLSASAKRHRAEAQLGHEHSGISKQSVF